MQAAQEPEQDDQPEGGARLRWLAVRDRAQADAGGAAGPYDEGAAAPDEPRAVSRLVGVVPDVGGAEGETQVDAEEPGPPAASRPFAWLGRVD